MWLRGSVIAAVNEALRDPARASSNAIIYTVLRLALHESLHGDKNVALQTHRPAYLRMIAMRGGEASLGMPVSVTRFVHSVDRLLVGDSDHISPAPSPPQDPNYHLSPQVATSATRAES